MRAPAPVSLSAAPVNWAGLDVVAEVTTGAEEEDLAEVAVVGEVTGMRAEEEAVAVEEEEEARAVLQTLTVEVTVTVTALWAEAAAAKARRRAVENCIIVLVVVVVEVGRWKSFGSDGVSSLRVCDGASVRVKGVDGS